MVSIRFSNGFRGMLEWKRVIAYGWLLSALLLSGFAIGIMRVFEVDYSPPLDNESGRAFAAIQSRFEKNMAEELNDSIMIWCDECKDIRDVAKPTYEKVMAKLSSLQQEHPDLIEKIEGYYGNENDVFGKFLSSDKKHMLINFVMKLHGDTLVMREVSLDIHKFVDKLASAQPQDDKEQLEMGERSRVHVAASGPYSQLVATAQAIEQFLAKDNCWAQPVIFVIIWYMLGSWKRSFIPFLCFAVTTVFSWAATLLLFKQTGWHLGAITPQQMVFVGLALNVDYGLFLLMRFREERARGQNLESSMERMVYNSGHVVLVSGLVLGCCWAMNICYPNSNELFMRMQAVGIGIVTLFSILVSLTLTPAMIATWPDTFDAIVEDTEDSAQSEEKSLWWKWGMLVTSKPLVYILPILLGGLLVPVALHVRTVKYNYDMNNTFDKTTKSYQAFEEMNKVFAGSDFAPYFVLVQSVPQGTGPTPLRPLKVLGQENSRPQNPFKAFNPFKALKTSSALEVDSNQNKMTNLLHPIRALQKKMEEPQPGILGLLAGLSGLQVEKEISSKPVHSTAFFEAACDIARRIIDDTAGSDAAIESSQVVSPFYNPMDGSCVDYNQVAPVVGENGLNPNSRQFMTKEMLVAADLYHKSFTDMVNKNGDAAIMFIRPTFEPYGETAQAFVPELRHILKQMNGTSISVDGKKSQLEIHFVSRLSSVLEVGETLDESFPYILAGSCFLMFGLVAIAFGSAFLPFRMLFTNALPVLFTYGVLVYVYQDGVLKDTYIGRNEHFEHLGSVAFTVLPFSFTVLMGLALDYDIFLMQRVWEYRAEGYDTRSAVVKALGATGPTITAAGIVMALAQSGALTGPAIFNNQLGFALVFGILLDCFLMRSVLVPCMLCWAPTINYWPTEMGPVRQNLLEKQNRKVPAGFPNP